MRFLYYDLAFLLVFILGLTLFFFLKRKNWTREGIMFLYKTQVGIKFIDYIGTKYKKTLKALSYVIVTSGYILMGVMITLLGYLLYTFATKPEVIKSIKVPPLMPLIPYLPSLFKIEFLPPFYFTYWIIAIAVIAMSHEFAHGIYARFSNIKVKSTGFGFLGPFLAAFVEPDEKGMKKLKKFEQLTILSAGTFANIIMTVLFFAALVLFFFVFYAPSGVLFNMYTPAIVNVSSISMIGGAAFNSSLNLSELTPELSLEINNESVNFLQVSSNGKYYLLKVENLEGFGKEDSLVVFQDLPAIRSGLSGAIIEIDGVRINDYDDLTEELSKLSPGENIIVKTKDAEEIKSYEIELAESEDGRAIIGIGFLKQPGFSIRGIVSNAFNLFRDPYTKYEPRVNTNFVIFIYNLLVWLILINLSVALVNMLPLSIFDGGRVFYLTVWAITKKKNFAEKAFKISTKIILIVFGLLMLLWLIQMI